MHLFSKVAIALIAAFGPSMSLGASLQLGKPAYGGPGCPAGSASSVLSADRTALSIYFTRFSVEAGGSTGHSLTRKACSLAIPVQVPSGLSVSVLQVDYAGYNQLPVGTSSQFNVEYFFAGGTGPKFTRSFKGPQSGRFTINNALTARSVVWSACGAAVNLRVNASLLVTSPGGRATAAINRANAKAAIVYRLQTRAC